MNENALETIQYHIRKMELEQSRKVWEILEHIIEYVYAITNCELFADYCLHAALSHYDEHEMHVFLSLGSQAEMESYLEDLDKSIKRDIIAKTKLSMEIYKDSEYFITDDGKAMIIIR